MEKRQRRLAFLIVAAVVIISAIPTIWLVKYGERLLPALELSSKVSGPSKPLPPIPFSVTVTQDKISTTATSELDEK